MPKKATQKEQLPLDYGDTGGTRRYGKPVEVMSGVAQTFAGRLGRTHNADQFANISAGEPHYTAALASRQAYAEAKPLTRGMRRSYDALTSVINQQYEHITRPTSQGGAGISVEVTHENPYSHPREMHEDVEKNNRLRVLSTESTGGHSLWSNDQNDRFRAVHDSLGHLAIGRDFSRHGEEAAFESHAATMPKQAHRALAAETRAQNAYMIYHPNKEFPPNAAVNVPSWMASTRGIPRSKKRKQERTPQPELPF